MELKVVCLCGQKYKFDVEPINLQMPFAVTCPVCGHDGTKLANALLMQLPAPPPLPIPAPTAVATAAAVPSGLRLNRTAEPPMAPPVPATVTAPSAIAAPPTRRPGPSTPTQSRSVPKYLQDNKAIMNNSFPLGILGAVMGAILDVAVVAALRLYFGFMFVMFGMVMVTALGIIMGTAIGFGARLLYKGTDFALGAICAGIAFITIGFTFFFSFGLIGLGFSIMALLIGTSIAFKIAS